MDLDPGSPYEDMSFSHGGIHVGVRMCEIVACLMNTWEDPDGDRGESGKSDKVPLGTAIASDLAATAVTPRVRLSLKCLGFRPLGYI